MPQHVTTLFSGLSSKLAAIVLFSFALFGCSGEKAANEAQQAEAQPKASEEKTENVDIALVMKTLTNPFFIEMERGARKAEADLGITLHVKTASQETSIQQQITIVDKLIQAGEMEAIVIAPGDSYELVPVIKRAQDAGIVVVNIDNQLDPAYSKEIGLKDVPFISVDNAKAAYAATAELISKLDKPTKVAVIEGIREAKNAEDRKNGAVNAFQESSLTEIVAMETANWKIDEGREVMKKILDSNPDLGAVFAANDMMAIGAVEYLQSIDRKDVLVAGYDALAPAVEAVNNGTLVTTIDQQAAEQGYQGVAFAHRAINGEKLPNLKLVDFKVITKQ